MNITLKNRFSATLFIILVSLITVKVFDFTLGFFSKFEEEKTSLAKPRSIVLREFTPNSDTTVSPFGNYSENTENLLVKQYRVRSDNNGFIIGPKDLDDDRKAQKVDIIFFGGSTTETLFVDEELRFPYLVSEMLLSSNGSPIRTLNGGLSGNNTMHSLFSFQAKGIPLKPKIVVLMHAINDVSALSKTLTYWETAHGRDLVRDQIYDNVDMYGERSVFYKVLKLSKDLLIPNIWIRIRHVVAWRLDAQIQQIDEWEKFRDKSYTSKDIEVALDSQFRAALLTFVKTAKAWGIEPVLMTQFNRIRSNDTFVKNLFERNKQPVPYEEFVRLYSFANNITREVAKKEKVLLIDLDREITPTATYLYDAVHLNSAGSRIVTEIISKRLVQTFPHLFCCMQ